MHSVSGIYGLYWPCDSDADCNTTKGALCLNNVCQCSVGYVFSEDITTCIKGVYSNSILHQKASHADASVTMTKNFKFIAESLYGEECVASSQCSHMLTGSKCTGVCECVEGYSYIRGRCKQLVELHSPCNQVNIMIECQSSFYIDPMKPEFAIYTRSTWRWGIEMFSINFVVQWLGVLCVCNLWMAPQQNEHPFYCGPPVLLKSFIGS